jgi:hypothetical protein
MRFKTLEASLSKIKCKSLSGPKLPAHKFDTSSYVVMGTTVRRESPSGKLTKSGTEQVGASKRTAK